jgi:signal transduction histidine kinase
MRATNTRILNRMTSIYEDKFLENHFYEANLKFRWISTTFASITLLYSLINLTIVLINSSNESDRTEIPSEFYEVNTYILSGVSLFCYFFNLYSKQYKLYYLSLYIQYILFSLNHFHLGSLIRLLYQLGNMSQIKNSNMLSILNFVFLFIDCSVKILWTLSPLNNFLYLLVSNLSNLLIIFGMSYQSSILFLDFGVIFFAYYAINFLLISLLSREILTLKKKNYLYENKFLEANKYTFIDTINSGYLRLEDGKVREKNKFFYKEAEILKSLLPFDTILESNLEGMPQHNESHPNLEKKFSDEDIYEILKNLILNISDNEEIKRFKKLTKEKQFRDSESSLNNFFTSEKNLNSELENKISINENIKTSEVNLKFMNIPQERSNQLELEVSTQQFLQKNNSPNNINLNSKQNEINQSYPDILKHLFLNKSKYKTYTYLGKSTILKGLDKTLSIKIYVRACDEKSIEFILNDVSKQEIYNGAMQFVIKTGQYMHDFKNPLICIHTEISELRDETELILGLICRHNEYIEVTSGKNSNPGNPQRVNSPKNHTNEKIAKIDFNYDECLSLLDKFEYIKQMSEYCQGMIGSFEDFSKSIFKPNSMSIKIENFDLIELLDFITNMMNLKLSHSNKSVKFFLKSENIPELDDINHIHEKSNLMVRSDEGKLKRVLINILSNSEKFTAVGSITLTVSKENINDKKYYKFSVQDTGRGMDANSLEKLFTPFFSENNNEHNKNGVGLGLLIVKEITEKLGLGIKVISEKGKGTNTVFYVEDHFISNNHPLTQIINNQTKNHIIHKQTSKNTRQNSYHQSNSSSNTQNHNNSLRSINSQFNMPKILDTTEEVVRSQFKKMEKVERLKDILKSLEESNNMTQNIRSERNNKNLSIFGSLQNFVRNRQKKLNTTKAFKNRAKLTINDYLLKYNTKESIAINEIDSVGRYSNNNNNTIKGDERKNVYNSIISNSSFVYQNISNNPNSTFQNLSVVKHEIEFEIKITPPIVTSSDLKKVSNDKKLSICDDYHAKNIYELRRRSFQFKSNSDKELTYSRPGLPGEKPKSNFCLKPDNSLNPSSLSNLHATGISISTNSLSRSKFFSDHKVSESVTISKTETNEILLDNYIRSVNILIIDDETSMRNFCINILKKISESEKLQIVVEEADDGFTGLAKIFNKYFKDKETYDLIITDDNMTFLDGSSMFNVLSYISDNDLSKLRIEDKILNKVVICSADTEFVRGKITGGWALKNLRLCEKPLNLEFMKSII